jgi:hypothetical protein
VAVDSSDNVVVTGNSVGPGLYPYNRDYATIKYSNAGMPLWTNRYDGPGNSDDYAAAVAVDGSGNVIVTGNSSSNGFSNCATTIKYSGAGVPLWTNRYIGGHAADLAVDGSGNVFVTGGYGGDYVTIKYSSEGMPLLTIARTTTNTVAVSWPSPSTGFTLQQNADLATTNWTPVGTAPADDGTTRTVIVNPPAGNRFYRLVRP